MVNVAMALMTAMTLLTQCPMSLRSPLEKPLLIIFYRFEYSTTVSLSTTQHYPMVVSEVDFFFLKFFMSSFSKCFINYSL